MGVEKLARAIRDSRVVAVARPPECALRHGQGVPEVTGGEILPPTCAAAMT